MLQNEMKNEHYLLNRWKTSAICRRKKYLNPAWRDELWKNPIPRSPPEKDKPQRENPEKYTYDYSFFDSDYV